MRPGRDAVADDEADIDVRFGDKNLLRHQDDVRTVSPASAPSRPPVRLTAAMMGIGASMKQWMVRRSLLNIGRKASSSNVLTKWFMSPPALKAHPAPVNGDAGFGVLSRARNSLGKVYSIPQSSRHSGRSDEVEGDDAGRPRQ